MGYSDKPWTAGYKLGPYKLETSLEPYPEVPLFAALDDAAAKYPGQTAIQFLERTTTYRGLKDQADRLAAGLAGLGVSKGDKVCLYLPNCPEFLIADWAVLKTGAAIVPVSVLRTDEALIHEAGSSRSKAIVCREEHLERALHIRDRCDIEHVIITSAEGHDVEPVKAALPENVYEFRTLIEDNPPTPPSVAIDPRHDLAILAFTGGATGVPKGVMLTHFNRYSNLRQGFPWIMKPMLKGIAGKASFFLPVPLFHSFGHYIAQSAVYLGLRIILMPDPRDVDLMVQYIKKYRPLMIPAVPTQLMRMAEAGIGRLNAIPMSGAAPLPVEVAEKVRRAMGSPVSEGYGLTETGPLTHFNITAFSKITGFMPKEKHGLGVPAPDTECKLADPLTGKEVPFGNAGEILVRGPQIMKGYWPEPGTGLDEDGWLHTGDIGSMDDEGFFRLSDRIKDMVNVSGNKVYTTEVDEVLFRHPHVLMAAAFGIPDPETPGSERIMAAIRLKDGSEGKVGAEDIRDFCRRHLAPYAVPKVVEFRNSIPMTATEKLFKKALRDEAIARMKQEGKLEKARGVREKT
ncbi:MAG: AMP-binding protein [Desulfomonilaceae bacterium]|nr:AMP-binding protein [Desulfomonilaceae bacterium]